MNIKDIISDSTRELPHIFNEDLYGSIYKKTEKIICAVFLITDLKNEQKDNNELVGDTRRIAKDVLMSVISILSSEPILTKSDKPQVFESLMQLRSMLHVLAASRMIRTELIEVIIREVDGVINNIYTLVYGNQTLLEEVIERQPEYAVNIARKQVRSPRLHKGEGSRTATPSRDFKDEGRRDAILAIIRARGIVSIKDISDSITDCSEKTIQRELTDMIKDNIITKTGERRWSRYSLSSINVQ